VLTTSRRSSAAAYVLLGLALFGTAQHDPEPGREWWGRPFAAVNVHLREDFDFSGNVNIVAGLQWKGPETRRAMRWGVQYFNGKSLQYSFFDQHEEWTGTGLWLDF